MIQSLVRKDSVDDLVADYGHVIVDECHHLPAVSFEGVLTAVRARFVTGLTATPHRRDGHHPIIEMQLGPVRFKVDARKQATHRPFNHRLIVRKTGFHIEDGSEPRIQELYRRLAADPQRNDLIFNDVLQAPVLLQGNKSGCRASQAGPGKALSAGNGPQPLSRTATPPGPAWDAPFGPARKRPDLLP
ncbi:MAG TPA: hypothetical protein ENI97_09915 [Gammaproteobacteria bacterium]|nr:hypothetical protein [Gammaproteobacteria bacterium]